MNKEVNCFYFLVFVNWQKNTPITICKLWLTVYVEDHRGHGCWQQVLVASVKSFQSNLTYLGDIVSVIIKLSINWCHICSLLSTQAIRILEDANLKDDEDEVLQSRALVKLYLNRSMCAIKLEKWDHAITFSNKALYLDPKNAKALYRFVFSTSEIGCKFC